MIREIGIKKTRMGINLAFILIFIGLGITCAIMWAVYQGNSIRENIIENGIEVKAECVDCFRRTDDNDMHRVVFICQYKYTSDNGKEYYTYRRYNKEQLALEQLGQKIPIVIDPYSEDVWDCDMDYINKLTLTYERDYILAIIFCIPVPIALYLLIYRGIYRSVMNYKISKKVGDRDNDFVSGTNFNADAVKVGEVTKTRSWIVSYVKVKYQDEKNETQEKWARAWFTYREAKFLKQKKFINIVPYKNTYGILEEMR